MWIPLLYIDAFYVPPTFLFYDTLILRVDVLFLSNRLLNLLFVVLFTVVWCVELTPPGWL